MIPLTPKVQKFRGEASCVLLYTETREAFIRLFETFARGIDPAFLIKRRDPFMGFLHGDQDSGKSLGVEILIKILSGHYDFEEMAAAEKSHMFIEDFQRHAMSTMSKTFDVMGQDIKMVFNSLGTPNQICGAIEEVRNDEKADGGACFITVPISLDTVPDQAWFSAEITKLNPCWLRSTILTVHNETLWRSPQFQKAWHALSEQSTTKNPNHTFNKLIL